MRTMKAMYSFPSCLKKSHKPAHVWWLQRPFLFYGFKLHLVINHKGEIMTFCLTKGNVDDRVPVEKLMHNLEGLSAANKGYISKKLEENLQQNNLKFITKVRKNMKKRCESVIECVRIRTKRIWKIFSSTSQHRWNSYWTAKIHLPDRTFQAS